MHTKVLLLVLLCCSTIIAQRFDIPHRNFTSLQDALQDVEKFILKFNETFNFPSLAFGMTVKGKPIIKKAWGLQDLNNYVPAKLSTKYRLASVSKSFTSAILGILVDQGLVHYDDPLSKYLNESIFPAKKWDNKTVNITLRNLLTHSAGVHVMTNMLNDMNKVNPVQNVTQTIAQFKSEQLLFKPGTNYSYSNFGYQLLGAVIESVTKKPYQVVATEFLRKHGLNSTYIGNMSVVLHDMPQFYAALEPNNLKSNIPTIPFDEMVFVNGHWPAGGYISTVDDLLVYGQLLIDSYKGRTNAILSKKTINQMWTAQFKQEEIGDLLKSEYAFGWLVATDNTKLKHPHIVWHSGGLIGTTTMIFVYPDEEIVGVALSNKGGIIGLDQMIAYTVENVYDLVK